MMQLYREVAYGLTNRNNIFPLHQIPSLIRSDQDMYASWYAFDESLIEHVKQTGSVADFNGNHYVTHLLLDADPPKPKDSSEDIKVGMQKSLDLARFLATRLVEEGVEEEWIKPFFSGRGWHIGLPDLYGFTPGPRVPEQVKAALTRDFPEADPIYDGPRIIRLAWSLNQKTGLCKIPVRLSELYNLSLDEIIEMVPSRVEKRDFNHEATKSEKIWVDRIPEISVPNHTAPAPSQNTGDTTNKIVTCIQKMFIEGPIQGSRHHKILRMTSAWRRAGLTRSAIKSILCNWAPDIIEKEITDIINNIFKGKRYSCRDSLMSEYCDHKCMHYKHKNYEVEVLSMSTLEQRAIEIVRSNEHEKAIDMGAAFNSIHGNLLMPATLTVVTGHTGMGKTALVQWLITKHPHLKCLFIESEVDSLLIYRRFVQQANGKTKQQVNNHYRESETTLGTELDHINIIEDVPDFKKLEQHIARHTPDVLVVDTTDGIEIDDVRDENKRVDAIMIGLSALAKHHRIPVIAVHHINKQGMGSTSPSLQDLKGSTATSQKPDQIWAIHGNRSSPVRYLTSLKERDGEVGTFQVIFRFETMSFHAVESNQNEQ